MNNNNAPWCALVFLSVVAVPAHAGRESVKATSPVQVISAEDVANTPPQTIEELMAHVPSVSIDAGQDPNTAVSVRGVGSPGVQLLINGTATDITGLGAIPPELIDRVEILRGPQGTLFGGNTTGGVVNVVTNDTYQGLDLRGSMTLDNIQRGLNNYWFTIESKEQCDATDGAATPSWTFSPKHDYGLPKISAGGDLYSWGSAEDGYSGDKYFQPELPLDFSKLGLLPTNYSYERYVDFLDRLRSDPDTMEQDKLDYAFGLMFASAFSGPGSLSDQAYAMGQFDPDDLFADFKRWAATRTDADRAKWQSGNLIDGFDPFSGLPAPAPTEAPPAAGEPAPAASPPSAVPDPFDQYPYPPDYAFDFSLCSAKQKKALLDLIDERDKARADYSDAMDYLRRDGQSAASNREDDAAAAEAIRTRDAKNQELHEKWRACTNPNPVAAADASTDSATAPADDSDSPKFDYGVGARWGREWNLEIHVDLDDSYGSADGGGGPAVGLGVGAYRYNYGLGFKLPLTPGAIRDTELDAGVGSNRAFTDEYGIGRLEHPFTGTGRNFYAPPAREPAAGGADAWPGVGARYIHPDLSKEWQIFADYDLGEKRGGPTVGLHYTYAPVDSIYQEFLSGDAKPATGGTGIVPDDSFTFGGKTFATYTFPQYGGIDYSLLDKVPGQTYWANNDCGDSALPPEGGGYLTAAQSPVKSVADQWALARVGLAGDEPKLDEFAKPVVVGVIDTGIDWNHLDFSWDNLWRNEDEIPGNGIDDDGNGYVDDVIGWSFTDENNLPWDNDGHGTFVAGVIAATQGNGAGIDGINGHARIMVLKAVNNFGRTRASYVARAIVYGADNGAQVLNLSVTGPGFPKIVQDAVDYAESKGVLVVAAAGNRAEDIDLADPPVLKRAVLVAATGPDDMRAAFSNVGTRIDIAAPGVDVVSLRARATDFMFNSAETPYEPGDAILGEDRRYYRSTGTSFAAPIVTGIASLVLSNNPGLSPPELKRVLVQSARDVATPGRDRFTGYGIVDAKAALAADPAVFVEADIETARTVDQNGELIVEVVGHADADRFAGAAVELGAGDAPAAWSPAGAPLPGPLPSGVLARFPATALANASTWTLRLVVRHENGTEREARYTIDVD